MKKLKISQIYFGKTDAYNEFVTYGRDTFKELFYLNPLFNVEKFLNGEAYYIYGDKGTGKTMILKYIESYVNDNPYENFTEFIRFKKDVDNDERNELKRASVPENPFEEVIEKTIPADISINATLAWQIYLIKVIISRIDNTEYGVFERDENYENLKRLLRAVYKDHESSVKRILPKIKRSTVEINFTEIAKLNLELEWLDSEKKTISFSYLAKKILSMYSELSPTNNNLYMLIDELELTLNKNKDYERDITLIRDLILAIQYLNEISKIKNFNVYIITALRNEVFKNIKSKGVEINKPIKDFGKHITWIQKGGDINQHPLIKMIENRIKKSEITINGKTEGDVWERYFVDEIHNKSIKNFILDQTWIKPRDIIRLFTVLQEVRGEDQIITQASIDSISHRYSEESWDEFSEELRAKYADGEVEGIKQALIGIQIPFEAYEFKEHMEKKKELYIEVEQLINKRNYLHILRDLYDIGVIGNYSGSSRFSFKGDQDIDPTQPLTIHYPLIRFFKANIKKRIVRR